MKKTILTILILILYFLNLSSQSTERKTNREEKVSFNFISSAGLMQPTTTITKQEYERKVKPKLSVMTEFGFEAEYNLNQNLSIFSGFLLHKRTYKEELYTGSTSQLSTYSFTFPIFMRYNLNEFVNSPYLSTGIYFNLENEIPFYTSLSTADGISIDKRQAISYNNISLGFEIGKRISIKRLKFSTSLHYNYSWRKSFSSEYRDLSVEDLENQNFGYGSSNGSVLGIRLKYHLGLLEKKEIKQKHRAARYRT